MDKLFVQANVGVDILQIWVSVVPKSAMDQQSQDLLVEENRHVVPQESHLCTGMLYLHKFSKDSKPGS